MNMQAVNSVEHVREQALYPLRSEEEASIASREREAEDVLKSLHPMVGEIERISFPVAERFVSVNGEGSHAGRLAAFIRFAGCNLRCSYCDTQWAQSAEAAAEQLSLDELLAWVTEQPVACVTLTGGEPVLQSNLPALIAELCELPNIEVVEIETNGSVDLAPLAVKRSASSPAAKLQFTMDYKLPSSGMEDRMLPENLKLLEATDVAKFVAGSQEDLETMDRIIRAHNLDERCQIYISPVHGQLDPATIVDYMQSRKLTQATLQLQLHKLIWPSTERGV